MTALYTHHAVLEREIARPPADVFSRLDDHRRLAQHMAKRDWRMLGSRLVLDIDPGPVAVGTRLRWRGRIAGVPVFAEEVVIEREPPWRKAWETVGPLRLLVIGHYRMGFTVDPRNGGSHVAMRIDYALPESGLWRVLGRICSRAYATWCLARMVDDAG